jgi:hypothetical protein
MTEPTSDLAEASPSPATINTGKQRFITTLQLVYITIILGDEGCSFQNMSFKAKRDKVERNIMQINMQICTNYIVTVVLIER